MERMMRARTVTSTMRQMTTVVLARTTSNIIILKIQQCAGSGIQLHCPWLA